MAGFHNINSSSSSFSLFIKLFNLMLLFVMITMVLPISSVEVTDSNDTSWGEFPDNPTGPPTLEYKYGGLVVYFDFARSFVYNSLGSYNVVNLYKSVESGIEMNKIKEVVIDSIGFVIAVVIGFLFVFIFLLVGLCFSCCRCCDRCGGKRIQKDQSDKKRKIYSLMLALNVILCTTGAAFMLACVTQLEKNLTTIPNTIDKTLSFADYQIDKLLVQVQYLSNKTETLLMDAIITELQNIGQTVGKGLKEDMNKATGIEDLFKKVSYLDTKLVTVQSIVHNVSAIMTSIGSDVSTLKTDLTNLQTGIKADCPSCANTNDIQIDFDSNDLPDITPQMTDIDNIVSKGLASKVQPSKKAYNDIPERVKNESRTVTKDAIKVINDFRVTVKDYKKTTKDLKKQINETFTSVKENDIAQSFDQYKSEYQKIWLAIWVPFGILIMLIPFLQWGGLVFGTCGNGATVKPTGRNCVSNCGGICLMSSVGLMFIFGSLFMLLTTVTYIPGSIAERYGCSLLRNIGDGELENLIAEVMPNKKVFGDLVPIKVNVTISNVYSKCKAGETLPKAVNSDVLVKKEIDSVEKEMKIKEKINNVQVDLSSVKIMNTDVENWFKNIDSGLKINFAKFKTELAKKPTKADLISIAKKLEDAAKLKSGVPQTKLNKLASDARKSNILVKDIQTLKDKLQSDVSVLEQNINETMEIFAELKFKIDIVEKYMKSGVKVTVKKQLEKFADKLLGIWKSFVSNFMRLLQKMVPCKPFVTVFEYLSIGFVCGTVDAFNGIWFGFGWFIIFFIPGIVLSVKLAKYFRRMLYSDEMDSSMEMVENAGYASAISNPQLMKNKVGAI